MVSSFHIGPSHQPAAVPRLEPNVKYQEVESDTQVIGELLSRKIRYISTWAFLLPITTLDSAPFHIPS